jgi:outer membrane receptor protein involved in Fe transport
VRGKHNSRAGIYGFAQQDHELFGLQATDGSGDSVVQKVRPPGNLEAVFLEDQYRVSNWLTLNGGIRLTHFSGGVSENAASPRAGGAITIPKLHWIVRGFYGRFYQAPPLTTVNGPLAEFAVGKGFDFLPLHGERDEQYEFGLTIPYRGWVLEASHFRTNARNFFDHDALGDSNLFLPLTIASARIWGEEVTLQTPRAAKHWEGFATFSHQFTEGRGAVTGGLTDFSSPDEGFFFLDHDQRNTFTVGGSGDIWWKTRVSASVNYGSGFLNGDGPDHLPAHAEVKISAVKSFGERFSVGVTATNLDGTRFLLDNSNTFGGTHFNDPGQIYGSFRWRFHY